MKKPFILPENDCERLNRTEMQAVRWCMVAADSIGIAQEALADRLKCIPYGEARWRLLLGQIVSMMTDVLGTAPKKQRITVRHTISDMDVRLVPKLTLRSDAAAIDVNDLSFLVRHAKKDICTACVLTDDECRQCELYKILESITPLQDWGDGTICPYTKEDWWSR